MSEREYNLHTMTLYGGRHIYANTWFLSAVVKKLDLPAKLDKFDIYRGPIQIQDRK